MLNKRNHWRKTHEIQNDKKNALFSRLFYFITVTTFASVNSDLNNFFNDLGFSDNTTAPNAYSGQEAGYYSGGGLFARDSVRDVQIAQVQLPSFRSGCGGIDLLPGDFHLSILSNSSI